MSSPLYSCPHCGANLSLDQLRGTDCPYCRSAFPHHARAVQHAALVNQVMAQNMAQFAISAPIVPVIPGLPVTTLGGVSIHVGAHMEAARRINDAIAATVAIAIASAIGLTIACALVFG